MDNEGQAEEELRAAQTLIQAADRGYRSLDVFATWFVGGTGAMLGLIVAGGNTNALLPSATLPAVLWRAAVAFGLILIAKFFGAIICSRAGGMEVAIQQMKEWREAGVSVDPEKYYKAVQRCMPWWMRKLHELRRQTTVGLARTSMWQGLIAGLSTVAACAIMVSIWWELAVSL